MPSSSCFIECVHAAQPTTPTEEDIAVKPGNNHPQDMMRLSVAHQIQLHRSPRATAPQSPLCSGNGKPSHIRIVHAQSVDGRCSATSKHVLPDPEVPHDPAADLLDGGMGGVERGNVLAAKDPVGQGQLALAALELGVAAAVVGKWRHAQAPVYSQVQLALPTSTPAAVMPVPRYSGGSRASRPRPTLIGSMEPSINCSGAGREIRRAAPASCGGAAPKRYRVRTPGSRRLRCGECKT